MTTITFLGAGSVVFTRDLLADLLAFGDLPDLKIRLHDIDVSRLATAEGIARATASGGDFVPEITSHLDRRESLEGADFVINSIQVGGFPATEVDFEVPSRFGLRQTIGDTVGVGGIFRALRTFPVLAAIAEDILEICPDAWFLNYTNPMAMNVAYLHAVAPRLKVVGLCHSVYFTVRGLCEIVGVPFDEVSYLSAGVNHQAWILRWEHEGADLYPRLNERIAADPELRRRVRVDMYRRLGFYPTESSEHSAEYLPWYMHSDAEIERLRIPVGDYLEISRDNVAEFEETRRKVEAGEAIGEREHDAQEYAPQIIHSIVTGTPRTIVVNVPNAGLIEGLPEAFTAEVPAVVDGDGIHPQAVGSLPLQLAAVNAAYVSTGMLTVAAAAKGEPRLLRLAMMMDANTSASLTVEQIWDLCNAMVEAHGDLLPPALRVQLSA
jgi:alpha-galactosidase